VTVILTWNIQAGLGCDGVTDLGRIAGTIRARDPDIVCLQEVARNVPEMAKGEDQVERLARLFPGYHAVFGAAIDRAGAEQRLRFGNLILSRLPVLQAFTHLLPQPAAPGIKHMPRQATEIVAETPSGPMRVVTTDGCQARIPIFSRPPGPWRRLFRRSSGWGSWCCRT
jgi:endonuclease/exonuclease/phosphatase family metal-dependent hydrolase